LPNQCNFIFINGPSAEVIRERLTSRGTETPEVIEKRIKNEKKEIDMATQLGFYANLVNDDLELSY